MATTFLTTGIVIGMRDFLEADRLYSVLTAEYGKLELRARGVRKISSKLCSHLEPFSVSEFMVVRGRAFDLVAGVEHLQIFPTLRQEEQKMMLMLETMHLVDVGTKSHFQDEELFVFFENWMIFLNTIPELSDERAEFLAKSFTLKLMALLGYRPELTVCIQCRNTMSPMSSHWHGLKGGLVCKSCTLKYPDQWFAARPIEDSTVKLVRHAMKEDFGALLNVRLPGEFLADFYRVVESLLISHFPVIPQFFAVRIK